MSEREREREREGGTRGRGMESVQDVAGWKEVGGSPSRGQVVVEMRA